MKITCVSDLHGENPTLSGGDLLIIAGDCTTNDSSNAWNNFFKWIDSLDYKNKVMVAGNHDNFCESWGTCNDSEYNVLLGRPTLSYLCDSGIEVGGLKIWGSPWTRWFYGVNSKCMAFMLSEQELEEKWKKIPSDIDILITHSPPHGILDCVNIKDEKLHVGSISLRNEVINRIKPKLHVFGHVHGFGGKTRSFGQTKYVNAGLLDENYELKNAPFELNWEHFFADAACINW